MEEILEKFKLNYTKGWEPFQGLTPFMLFGDLYYQYRDHNIPNPKNGTDYGNPRFDMFQLMWLSLPQSQPKATVTVTSCITDPDGTTHCTTF